MLCYKLKSSSKRSPVFLRKSFWLFCHSEIVMSQSQASIALGFCFVSFLPIPANFCRNIVYFLKFFVEVLSQSQGFVAAKRLVL